MNFKEKIANFRLGNYSTSQLPEIALTALEEEINSESFLILAGMSEKDNSFEILDYFNRGIQELNLQPFGKLDSVKILLRYYLRKMINNPEQGFDIFTAIVNQVYHNYKFDKEFQHSKEKYVGELLDLGQIFIWYRELQDFKDNDRLLYYNHLPKDQQKEKFELHLIEEANNLLIKLEEEKDYTQQ